ncbi:aldehyde dehydrogenase (NADP(+)) [Marinimicrobium sp. LS-A18]|uniref:aldehyde dehydrogenase (NADP(+)) n=1 Tax=Marinimicrobium sp. LS-A18 TaxID=1381596 RepID=UPI0004634B6D|nr:aldehyde dehydrogenase (NADP(+)) [Marinimicrobium sp. LS-A18]
MRISGDIYYQGEWHKGESEGYQALDPASGKSLEPVMSAASEAQVDTAAQAAAEAFAEYRNTSLTERARFLRCCADEIMNLGEALTDRVSAETGYPTARAEGERARTCGQLRMFADYIESGDHLDARIDTAQPDRQPLPKPDLRYVNQALGPVAVFGVANFPLAFSVAGGDTASALAAGCPVVVKSHPSHPGTSELVGRAMATAAEKSGMPAGVFSLLRGDNAVGARLVQAPQIKAVGFTGSFKGGMALHKLANERPDPIPVFAEMSSVNPLVLLPEALKDSAETIAKGFVGSMTMGTGQFCVKPGLVLALEGAELEAFLNAASEQLQQTDAGVMLNEGICSSYDKGLTGYLNQDFVQVLAQGREAQSEQGFHARPTLLRTRAEDFLKHPEIHDELFGPASLVVVCKDSNQLRSVLDTLDGQLSGTIHSTQEELAHHKALVDLLTEKVGRLVINGFPTGVEVCPSMMHGGPFPASTDARFTSVGTAAIQRFLRPVCFQNFPEPLLPDALRDSNPLKLTRVVNGTLSQEAL